MPGPLLVCAVSAWLAAMQQAPPADAAQVDADALPVSIARIQRALSGPPPIDLKEQHPVFRLEVFGRKPTLEDVLGERFWVGPAPYGGMTHQEFLTMVTPKLAQPYAGFTGKYLVAETALALMEQLALKSAVTHLREAKTDHEREAARKEVLDALAALERARKAAGLDKEDRNDDK
jgi:hypothetical protein